MQRPASPLLLKRWSARQSGAVATDECTESSPSACQQWGGQGGQHAAVYRKLKRPACSERHTCAKPVSVRIVGIAPTTNSVHTMTHTYTHCKGDMLHRMAERRQAASQLLRQHGALHC